MTTTAAVVVNVLVDEHRILHTLTILTTKVDHIMAILDDLKTKVTANTSLVQSAITLIQGLKQKLDEAIASGDPAQLQALSDELDTTDQGLAAALVANTPAAPPTP